MKRFGIREAVTCIITVILLTATVPQSARAQTEDYRERKPTDFSINAQGDSNNIPLSDPVSSMPTQKIPDVHIVVAPSKGKFIVSAVYSTKVDRSVADAHLKALLDRTKWNAQEIVFEDGQVTSIAGNDPSGMSPVMSSITFTTDAPVIDKDNVVTVEPFLVAFRDRSRVNLTFMGENGSTPVGPRSYTDENVRLSSPLAPYALTYMVEIKNHNFNSVPIPRTDSSDSVAGKVTLTPPTNWLMVFVLSGLGVLAVLVAGMVFMMMRRTA